MGNQLRQLNQQKITMCGQDFYCPDTADFLSFSSRKESQGMVSLQKGLSLFHGHFDLQKDIVVEAESPSPVLEFGCLLSGAIEGDSITDGQEKRHWGGQDGHAWLSYCSRSESTITYFCGRPIHVVVFQIAAPLLPSLFLDTDALNCVEQLNNQLANAHGVNLLLQEIIAHIKNRNFCLGELDRLYLTSKSYELLFQLRYSITDKHQVSLSANRSRTVERAVRMIQKNLDAPLSLEQVAREAGICATGLNAGFKEAFGTTVFGYIRQQRLARAKELMEHRGKTASEAAWESGYQSLSSFHRAFYAQYGVTPGVFSKKTGRIV